MGPNNIPRRPTIKKRVVQWLTYLGLVAGALAGLQYGYELYKSSLDYREAREAKLEKKKEEAAKKTLTKLYYSWETKDINTYLNCWDPTAVQLSDMYARDYKTIVAKRTEDFEKYKRVLVKFLQIKITDVNDNLIEVYTVYSMHFEPVTGDPFNETYVRERYFLMYNEKTKTCKIIRNDAYISGESKFIGPREMKQWVNLPAPDFKNN